MTELKPRLKPNFHGWLILDKPLGLTSTQALGKVRKLLGGKKAGHGGTLDPLASGVLPLAFGEATKLIPYVMDGDKVYEFTITWGEQRDTDDAEGAVIARSDQRPIKEDILQALGQFRGIVNQRPPNYSAIKLDGKRAYDIARAGGEPLLVERQVLITQLELKTILDQDHAAFKVVCGKGMYVRSLARDLAAALGCFGYVSYLRRVRVGNFGLESAISLEKLEELSHNGTALQALLAMEAALDDIPGLHLEASEAQRLKNGQSLLIRPEHRELLQYSVILAKHAGVPVALVAPKEGVFHVLRGFYFGS